MENDKMSIIFLCFPEKGLSNPSFWEKQENAIKYGQLSVILMD